MISNAAWARWLIMGKVIEEYSSKIIFTALQSIFSVIQSFFIAFGFERYIFGWKLGLDIGLLAIAYCASKEKGISILALHMCLGGVSEMAAALSTGPQLVSKHFEVKGEVEGGELNQSGFLTMCSRFTRSCLQITISSSNLSISELTRRNSLQMDAMKPYFVVILIRCIYVGMYLLSKIAFDKGLACKSPSTPPTYPISEVPGRNFLQMDAMKPYLVTILIRCIYFGMYLLPKTAFDKDMNIFVFVF
ncbi:hypothetical protein Taro_043938 [Colocasia esculenta]|uniref:Uncharacterized protein n=1 Tax=Colocasia esculenta TaxID=4460 RepID=A0A843X4S4_COLES|nr:hypothetical protein [Colocasia esculenta]